MPRLRLRHPNGQTTLNVPEDASVQSLLVLIQDASGIYPSEQIVKAGYPPRSLTLIPELPLSSLGLEPNDQLTVSRNTSGAAQSAPAPQLTSSIPPAVAQPTQAQSAQDSGPDSVATPTGYLVHRIVPDDNSCLFTSLSLLLRSPQDQSQLTPTQLRALVARNILADPVKYNEAILGMQPEKYAQTINKPSTWGGAIELSVLAQEFNVEICSIDVETGRMDQFEPEGGGFAGRCFVLYSGIHYDAATLTPELGAPDEWHQTTFPTSDAVVVNAAQDLATKLRAKKAFTNTATFSLKCEQCGQGLVGEKEARQHAEQTGHVRFGEY